jgi:16S rRNA (uracil1498-N3)-methyltransferase
MTRRRFYVPHDALPSPDVGARVTLAADESRHLRDVLRLRVDDEAFVFDGAGREFRCVVAESGSGRGVGEAVLEVRERVEPLRPESPLELALALALLKGEKFDMVVQKATELGVARVEPVLTARADVRPRDARDTERRVERWRRLALEASKQSGRARVPSVESPQTFERIITREPREETARLLFSERGGAGLNSIAAGAPAVVALVGPEGGWDDEELSLARAHGWTLVTLGGRTLRAETAAITVCALLQHTFGDLR